MAGLMLLIRYRPVRPAERPPGATAHHVHATWMRGCACARGCTRGGLVFAWVYAWWSRGPPECYSITKGQRLERTQTIGPKRANPGHLLVTSWSPHGHLMVTSWSPRGHLVVAAWSPRGHLVVTSWSPHGHLIMSHIWRPPAPYRFF